MDYPFKRKFGREYQQKSEYGRQNEFRRIQDIVVVKTLSNNVEFLVDFETWNRLPWGGWDLNKNGYISNCGVQLHRVSAWLNGLLEDDDYQVIDHINRNRLDNRLENIRSCNAIQNGWNTEKHHGHQLKNGKWKFTFSKSFPSMAEAEKELSLGRFNYMNKNRTCFNECIFNTYEEGYNWWRFQAGLHYGEFSPFANPYKSIEQIINEATCTRQS